jgi:hypothetical protein
VPFGTGRAISRSLRGDAGAITFYRTECFRLLGAWLGIVTRDPDRGAAALIAEATAVSPHLAEYLEQIGFAGVWKKLRANHKDAESLSSAFHVWFDGLKSMKLIHHLAAGPFPRCEPGESLPDLLAWGNLAAAGGVPSQLHLLRNIQNGTEFLGLA